MGKHGFERDPEHVPGDVGIGEVVSQIDLRHGKTRRFPLDARLVQDLHERSGVFGLHPEALGVPGRVIRLLGVSEEAVKSRIARGRLNFTAAYKRLERGLRA